MKKSLPLLVAFILLSLAGWSQTIDPSFSFRTLEFAHITTTATAADGSVFVAGNLSYFNGTDVGRIIKISAGGEIDESFSVPSEALNLLSVSNIVLYPDGRVLAVGYFRHLESYYIYRLVRFNADGTLDETFDPSFPENPYTEGQVTFYAMGLQSDEKIIVNVRESDTEGTATFKILRLDTDGSVDESFVAPGADSDDYLTSIVVLPDDDIIIGGKFSAYNSVSSANRIARLNSDGSFDDEFNANLASHDTYAVQAIVRLADGSLVVDDRAATGMLKFLADGSPDPSFNWQGTNSSRIIFKDGSTVVVFTDKLYKYDATGASVKTVDNLHHDDIIRYGHDQLIHRSAGTEAEPTHVILNSDLDQTGEISAFSNSDPLSGTARHILPLPDGKLLVKSAGQYFAQGTTLHKYNGLFRLNADLTFDDTFSFEGFANSITLKFVDSKGRILYTDSPTERYYLKRLNSDGSKDDSFEPLEGRFYDIKELGVTEYMYTGVRSRIDDDPQYSLVQFDESGTPSDLVVQSAYNMVSVNAAQDGDWLITIAASNVWKINPVSLTADPTFDASDEESLDIVDSDVFGDQIFVTAAFYKESGNSITDVYPLWKGSVVTGNGKVTKEASLLNNIGVDMYLDHGNGLIYLLTQVDFNGTELRLHRFKADGSLDKNFNYVSTVRKDVLFPSSVVLLKDKSLLIVSEKIEHVLIPAVPNAPSNVQATRVNKLVKITWQDNSDNETAFDVQKSADGGETWALLQTVNKNIKEYTESNNETGTYKYRVFAINAGGYSESDEVATIDIVTGLDESTSGFKVFPNPAKDQLNVQSDEVVERFTIHQMDGRTMETAAPHSKQFSINMNNYSAGLYLLKLEHSGGKKVFKIFKQ